MSILEFLFVPLILIVVVLGPIWIIFHYGARWRAAKSLSSEDEAILRKLWDDAERMEKRIRTLEKILDAESPDWRERA